jgi:excisionase family DNA binding protein
MNTENARLTRKEVAELLGVTERTVNRWSARGLIRTYRPTGPWGLAYYDREEVLSAAGRATVDVPLPEPETDISG